MDNFKDGLILYHGSYCEVKIPDLKCSNSKDFGQVFYLTVSKLQAKDLIKESIVKSTITGEISEGQNYGFISKFELHLSKELKIKLFEEANVDWLHCIIAHRKGTVFKEIVKQMKKYDVIIG